MKTKGLSWGAKLIAAALIGGLVCVWGLGLRDTGLRLELMRVERQKDKEEYTYSSAAGGSWRSFRLYFLGFDERWFLNGLKPVKLRAMVFGYFDRRQRPALAFFAGPTVYKGRVLTPGYADPARLATVYYNDQEKFVERLKPHRGELITAAARHAVGAAR